MPVMTISLRRLIEAFGLPGIDLLKIDCEGCEFAVLPEILKFEDVVGELHWHAVAGVGSTEIGSKAQLVDELARRGVIVE